MTSKVEAKLIYGMTLKNKKRLKFPIAGVNVTIHNFSDSGSNYVGKPLVIQFNEHIEYFNNPKCGGLVTSVVKSVEYKENELRIFTLNSKYVFKLNEDKGK